MHIRLAAPEEAEVCWNIRNCSIRAGCQSSYSPAVLEAWTPEAMPESYREAIAKNPFFVVDVADIGPVATGYLDLSAGSIEAIFTLPAYFGQGFAGLIIEAIKSEAAQLGFTQLSLSSTPNAQTFYEKHGFMFIAHGSSPSRLAKSDLRCIHMGIELKA